MEDYGFCRQCGKVKEKKNLPFCLACYEFYRADLTSIKEYLKTNSRANAMDIARGTGIELERILYFIKQGVIKIKR